MGKGRKLPALFSIGLNVGGLNPANREVCGALGDFQRRVVLERESFANEGLRVNLVFDIPGHMFRPDFEGVVAARFDHKRTHLLVLAAVPDGLTAAGIGTYVNEVLEATRGQAHAYAAKHRLQIDLTNLDAVIDQLRHDSPHR